MSVYIPSLFEMKRPSVRRCLFERPTAEKQESDFGLQEARLSQDEKMFREKWGLDPKTGTIVSGAEYVCVPVDLSKESIPTFYTKGYAPRRKPKPVQSLRRERCSSLVPTQLNFDCPKPMKRRYPAEDELNDFERDENCEILFSENNTENQRVPLDGEVVITANDCSSYSPASSSISAPFPATLDVSNSPMSLPIARFIQNSKLVKSPSMPDISPRSTDLCTPQQRPRSLTQKTIKDYLPCKKARCVAKILPRT